MYWSRVKTILIFLFLSLDIFLLGYIFYSGFDETRVSADEIKNTAAVLARNNIKISEQIIPDRTYSLGIVELDSLWTDKENMAKVILGDGMENISENVFRRSYKRLEISENGFVYTTNLHTITVPDAETAEEELKKMRIFVDDEDGIYEGNKLEFIQKIEGMPVFETGISVKTVEDELAEASGYWILSGNTEGMVKKQASLLKSATGVLINFIENPIYDKSGDEIVKIETGYSTGSIVPDTGHKLVSVVPAYKITLKNGDYAMYDAINGELLYNSR